ncbi:MAG: 16S rRNA (adenine(1518)-N(6)/adenine(1519)-N(6))-dimethyltransferase RsmA [Bacteroidota bacterium]
MKSVRAKKHLGQHFLEDLEIAEAITKQLQATDRYQVALEVGPGMGVLTQFLLQREEFETQVVEIDQESVNYLKKNFPELKDRIWAQDFLETHWAKEIGQPFALIGNFPYNISSPIFFNVLDLRDHIPEVVGMLQKEVAQRIAAREGNKTYGILSVFLQTFYDIEYCFDVPPEVFDPPPKVDSGVIRLVRNERKDLEIPEKLFRRLVKQAFSTRRKTLRNALKSWQLPPELTELPVFGQRAEQLSVEDFLTLGKQIHALED